MSQAAVGQTATMTESHHDAETDIYLFKGDKLPISSETDDEVCCQHSGEQGETPIWIPKEKISTT